MFQQGEVLACDSFKSDSVHFILPIEQRQWAVCDCTVTCEYFFITINYDKEKFQHKIGELWLIQLRKLKKVICTGMAGRSTVLCVRKLMMLAVTSLILLL